MQDDFQVATARSSRPLPARRVVVVMGSLLLASAGLGAPALASLGPFEPGNGVKAQGLAGISYAIGEETTVLYGNPAHLFALGERIDIGITLPTPFAQAEIEGNALADDEVSGSVGRRFFYIPQGGFSRRLGERWMFGMSGFAAGLGTDFTRNPFRRYGGGPRAHLFLSSAGISSALAFRLQPGQVIGASLNLGYQTLDIQGVEFLGDPAVSERPDKVSNQGKDGSPNISFTLGWRGQLSDRVHMAASYRSKTWANKHDDYSGLLPEQGTFEFPAIYGAGIAYVHSPALTLAFDYQRYQYASQKAFGHRLSRLTEQGNRLGSDNGPGFGVDNQDAYKFGVRWQPVPAWTLRLGYIAASQMVQDSQTFFGILGLMSATKHYSAGFTRAFGQWEWSGHAIYSPPQEVKGRNSIPAAFGGGEANNRTATLIYGFSLGKAF